VVAAAAGVGARGVEGAGDGSLSVADVGGGSCCSGYGGGEHFDGVCFVLCVVCFVLRVWFRAFWWLLEVVAEVEILWRLGHVRA